MRDRPSLRDAAAALPADTTITVLESHDRPPAGLARVGGPGFDLGERQPAADDGEAMTHIWTLPTADVPALRAAFPGAVAVALYILRPQENEAYEVDNGQTALVALGPDDVARGPAAPTEQDLRPRHVTATQLEVASSAFAGYYVEDADGNEVDEEEDSPRRRLRQAIYALSARAGGGPIWLQGDEYDGDFLLQFDESFADVNLGDVGVMYIFTDQQFWQCH
jgi:hypothetical protein